MAGAAAPSSGLELGCSPVRSRVLPLRPPPEVPHLRRQTGKIDTRLHRSDHAGSCGGSSPFSAVGVSLLLKCLGQGVALFLSNLEPNVQPQGQEKWYVCESEKFLRQKGENLTEEEKISLGMVEVQCRHCMGPQVTPNNNTNV